LALACFSLGFAFAFGELGLRALLLRNQQAHSLKRLKELREQGKQLPIRGNHPLATIIDPSLDPKLIYELRPRLDTSFGGRRVRTNAEGMRDDSDYAVVKPADTVRIIGIGDSGMFGWGVEQGEEYLGILRTTLASRAGVPRYEVLNLAVPGYNSALEVQSLFAKGLRYAPDIVIVGWCDNDFAPPFFLLEPANLKRRDMSFLFAWLFNRERFDSVVGGAHFKGLGRLDQEQMRADIRAGVDVGGVQAAFRRLLDLARENGFEILVFGAIAPEACAIFDRLGMPYLDLHATIPRDRYPAEWAVHFVHPRPPGHRVLAGYLERELIRRGWIK
jgi:hypothetical protein